MPERCQHLPSMRSFISAWLREVDEPDLGMDCCWVGASEARSSLKPWFCITPWLSASRWAYIRAGKNDKLNFFFVAKIGPFGTPFLTPKFPLKKFMWVPLLRSFPGNEAHKLFPGGPKWGVLGGRQKVYVEKVYVLFLFWSPNILRVFFSFSKFGEPRRVGEFTKIEGRKQSSAWCRGLIRA